MRKLLLVLLTLTALIMSGCATKDVVAGYTGPKEVSTYFDAPLMSTADVKKALTSNGFEVLSVSQIDKKVKADVIVFTHPHLKELANKPTRGFLAGALRAVVDKKGKKVRISNPRYYVRAFLQKDYKLNDEVPVLDALHKAFPNTTPSADKMEFDKLGGYNFMVGMPYYEDYTVVEGSDVAAMQAKIEKFSKKKGKPKKNLNNIVFKLKLDENRVLYGVNLDKRNARVPGKIGIANGGIFPWMVLVENVEKDGKVSAQATALRPEYYIGMSYPLLDLGGFATIMFVRSGVPNNVMKMFK